MNFPKSFPTKYRRHLASNIARLMLAGMGLLFGGLFFAGLFLGGQGAAALDDDGHKATPITTCGTAISQPGRYYLANDLKQCPGMGVSITVSYVEVELRGHTIQGTFGDNGIVANGGDAGISSIEIEGPGTVTGFLTGVVFENVHRSRTHNVVALRNKFGMAVNAGDFTNAATVAATVSTDNEIRDNVFTGNTGHGITVNGGNENRFIHNNLSNNGGHGLFLFAAANNVARHNTALVNGGSGIDLGKFGPGNLINDNIALGNNGFDLNDENGDCTHNTWTDNSFLSNNPGCVQ
ncbi:MAG TPA: right-handed parallel beta-helix repeat-containing protein [Candidatus Angelobacter sp.]|nr:right-handed parallel beta-helix repeat-containing protein [Candidatus Angelobacter sp.]